MPPATEPAAPIPMTEEPVEESTTRQPKKKELPLEKQGPALRQAIEREDISWVQSFLAKLKDKESRKRGAGKSVSLRLIALIREAERFLRSQRRIGAVSISLPPATRAGKPNRMNVTIGISA